MTRVLVTGASGTVGRWCVDRLRSMGVDVIAVSRGGPAGVDLLDRAAVTGLLERIRPEGLVHLAWETRHGHFWTAPSNTDWLEASTWLAAEFARQGGQRLVVAGTCAEYDWSPSALGDGTCREYRTPLKPCTPYGMAKLALSERLASSSFAGVEVAWGRIFSTYGPGEAAGRLVPSVAHALLEGRLAAVSSGRVERDYLHARDVGAGFAALYASRVTGAVNVASGLGVRLAEVVRLVAEAVGRPELIRIGAIQDREDEPLRLIADVTSLVREVGFAPATNLEEGIREVVADLQR